MLVISQHTSVMHSTSTTALPDKGQQVCRQHLQMTVCVSFVWVSLQGMGTIDLTYRCSILHGVKMTPLAARASNLWLL